MRDPSARPISLLFLVSFLLVSAVACGGGDKGPGAPGGPSQTAPAPSPQPGEEGRAARTIPIPGQTGDQPTGLPPGHPPLTEPPGAATGGVVPPPEGSGSGDKALTWKIPTGWVEETPSSSLRRAQYRVPGAGGDGECIVFYFGPGQGGDARSNAVRWAGMFKQPDGSDSTQKMKTSETTVGGIKVLLVEVSGTYAGGMTMTMAPAEDSPGYMLLGAVAEGPDSNWFFKLTGPEATVTAQRAAFDGMIKSLKAGA